LKDNTRQPTGMRGFTIVWFGQLVSMLGTGMTNFALSFWIFEKTGQATALTIAIFCFVAPSILLSPLAGALVDRWNRKMVIILTDLAAGIVTIVWLLILVTSGDLELWQIYLGNIITGAFNALQFPAFSAAVTLMIPKKQYGRAAGMMDFAGAASNILAPLLAGALLGSIGLAGIMFIDVVTFIFAISAILLIHIPQPALEPVPDGSKPPSLWQDSIFGFRYIKQRPSLLGLQFVFTAINFIGAFGLVLMIPMILARTGNDAVALATTQAVAAFGGVAGGLIMSTWGGPKRRIKGVLFGMTLEGLLGPLVMGVARNVVGWAIGGFFANLFLPIINGSNQAIWQSKVPPALQGRVFATRRMIAQISFPVAVLLAGPLADNIFEPAMSSGGWAETTFGWLVGTGPGAGIGLMMVLSGLAAAVIGLGGYMIPAIRNVEDILPDFDAEQPVIVPEMEPAAG
jgi:MFS transporter, DHA3 family, macrolide efflux protein